MKTKIIFVIILICLISYSLPFYKVSKITINREVDFEDSGKITTKLPDEIVFYQNYTISEQKDNELFKPLFWAALVFMIFGLLAGFVSEISIFQIPLFAISFLLGIISYIYLQEIVLNLLSSRVVEKFPTSTSGVFVYRITKPFTNYGIGYYLFLAAILGIGIVTVGLMTNLFYRRIGSVIFCLFVLGILVKELQGDNSINTALKSGENDIENEFTNDVNKNSGDTINPSSSSVTNEKQKGGIKISNLQNRPVPFTNRMNEKTIGWFDGVNSSKYNKNANKSARREKYLTMEKITKNHMKNGMRKKEKYNSTGGGFSNVQDYAKKYNTIKKSPYGRTSTRENYGGIIHVHGGEINPGKDGYVNEIKQLVEPNYGGEMETPYLNKKLGGEIYRPNFATKTVNGIISKPNFRREKYKVQDAIGGGKTDFVEPFEDRKFQEPYFGALDARDDNSQKILRYKAGLQGLGYDDFQMKLKTTNEMTKNEYLKAYKNTKIK